MKINSQLSIAIGVALSAGSMFGQINYPDFSSGAGLQLNGDAAVTDNVLRLTPANFGQAGSAFSTTAVTLGVDASFSAFFQFRISESGGIGDEDGAGADGLMFVVQTVANNVGASGGGIGYEGLLDSLGVEFDTFNNGTGLGDPNGNHVAFNFSGTFSSSGDAVMVGNRLNNSAVWSTWVDYDGATGALELRLVEGSAVRPVAALLSTSVDLASVLGSTSAFVGFTSGTGSGYGNHDILNWVFRNEFDPVVQPPGELAPVPEPSTYGLIAGTALLASVMIRRRRAAVSRV